MLVVGEIEDFLNFSGTPGETVKDAMNISTWLHRNDAEVILFVDPDKEGLLFVVEDTTTVGPVAVETTGLLESVSLPIKSK
jgi:hypothetical protein